MISSIVGALSLAALFPLGRPFVILFQLTNPHGNAYLKYFLTDGRMETISQYKAIGTGSFKGDFFLHQLWNPEQTMNAIAEIGYFIIKYIEKFNLDYTVGVGSHKPQIWFIPDNSLQDYQMSPTQLEQLDNKTNARLNELDIFTKHLIKL